MRLGVVAEAADEQDGDLVGRDAEGRRAAPRVTRIGGEAREIDAERDDRQLRPRHALAPSGPSDTPPARRSAIQSCAHGLGRADHRVPVLHRRQGDSATMSIAPGEAVVWVMPVRL